MRKMRQLHIRMKLTCLARADTSYDPVSVSVCHKSVFCRNGWTEQSVVLPVILTLIDLVLLGLIVLLLYVCYCML